MLDPPAVGPTIHEHRRSRGWTLDDLALRSGVSRSMVSQVERGQANPTFATLWNLTQALGIDLADLTTDRAVEPVSIEIAPASRTPSMSTEDGGVSLRILNPAGTADVAEWYELTFRAGGRLVSSAHATDTMEHLTVLDGALVVEVDDATEQVPIGATARYPADRSHTIAAPDGTARALLVVIGGAG